mgnify:CR=1 FL=1
MDIKQYIDYFDELSHLERDKQFALLEQVRDEIKKNYRFNILGFISTIVRLTFVLLFTGGSYLILGLTSWKLALPLLLALLCAKVAVTEINDAIIVKFIKNNLANNATEQHIKQPD